MEVSAGAPAFWALTPDGHTYPEEVSALKDRGDDAFLCERCGRSRGQCS